MRTTSWPLEDAEVDAVLRSLQFRHYKWDIYHRGRRNITPDAIVLTRAEHQALVATAESVWRALREVEDAAIADDAALARLGIPERLRAMIRAQRPGSPRVTRCDFHPTADGRWLISEFNEDGPGGFVESVGLSRVLAGDWGARFENLVFEGDLEAAITAALAPFPRIGLVYPTAYSEDLQHVALVAEWLEESGQHPVMGSPANLVMRGDVATLFDQPIDALFRYFPGEWLGELPNAADWERAASALPIVNSLSALVAQSKRVYAAAGAGELSLSAEARARVAAHVPQSMYLEPSLVPTLLVERDRWVLKAAFGRMGDTVRLGIGSSPEAWERALDRALEEPGGYVVQERFEPAPLWFSGGLRYAAVGMFLVDGRFAGYYTRVSPHPVINYDASHVATLVEVS